MDERRSGLRGIELAPPSLIERMERKGRSITFAAEGSDELRYLEVMGANANVGGERLTHILIRPDVRAIELWEEFLHGTQMKCRVIERRGIAEAEIRVKDFMIRHRRRLQITEADAAILTRLAGGP